MPPGYRVLGHRPGARAVDFPRARHSVHGRDDDRDDRIYTAKEENREVAQVLIHQVSWEPDHL